LACSLSRRRTQCADAVSGRHFPRFHAEAADQARAASMPDTAWPISGHPPGSSRSRNDTPVLMSSQYVSTYRQRFAFARLPDPHLTPQVRLFRDAHHVRHLTAAAHGGLKSPPTGRLRRATAFISCTTPRSMRSLPHFLTFRVPGAPFRIPPETWVSDHLAPFARCGRFSRPPWPVVTPATTTGPPSP
jgi:hypothetical protein